MHHASTKLMSEFIRDHLDRNKTLEIYDIGSMGKSGKYGTYKRFFDAEDWNYNGVDIMEGPNVDIVVDPYEWDIPDETADVVVSGQCMEHVEKFWLWFGEVRRITRTGGLVCMIAPSSGREHRYPVDCWRFLPDGMKVLCGMNNMKIIKCEIPKNADVKWKDCLLIATKQKE